jgi:anthranilate synthase component I
VSLPRFADAARQDCVCYSYDVAVDLLDLQRWQPQRYPHLLESVAHGTPQARYDILFAFPEASLALGSDGRIRHAGAATGEAADFLSVLDRQWRIAAAARLPATVSEAGAERLPFTGGWFVYLGYELAAQIEPRLGDITKDPQLPVASLTRVPAAIIRDRVRGRISLLCEADKSDALIPQMQRDLRMLPRRSPPAFPQVAALREDAPRLFLDGVTRALAYIRAGDVFQVNLSRGWYAALPAPIAPATLYERLRGTNPAPFAGLMTLAEDSAIISSSPERLVRVAQGRVFTRPIAGTYPRSDDRGQDERFARQLLRHPKERAEHVMLIDLERNDLGRVCRTGSVKVDEFMVLESYRHVHHIVSQVSGMLRPEITPGQVIRAVFPGGTITGCPKVRCMEIIAELERVGRGPYTGSFGYINHDGSMDLNILIRTMRLSREQITLRAGAGIVADSRPRRELYETRAKAKGLLRALGSE